MVRLDNKHNPMLVIKVKRRGTIICKFWILVFLIATCSSCEGWKTLDIINCTNEVAIIKTTSPDNHWQQKPISYYNNRNQDLNLNQGDTNFPRLQIEYWQMTYNTEGVINVNGDTLSILLEPEESMQIAQAMWLFYPGRFKEPSLDVNNIVIISLSDTCIAQNRSEVLRLQHDKRFKFDKKYEYVVGQNTRKERKILIK